MILAARALVRVIDRAAPLWSLVGHDAGVSMLRRIGGISFLVYHEVDRGPPDYVPAPLVVHPDRFAAELRWASEHFEIISIDAAIERIRSGNLESPAFVICFDDGFAGVRTHAYPVLTEHRAPAAIFANSSFLRSADVALRLKVELLRARVPWEEFGETLGGTLGSWDELVAAAKRGLERTVLERVQDDFEAIDGPVTLAGRYLGMEDVEEMSPELVSVCNHTASHPWLAGLDRAAQEREILEGDRFLRALPHYRPYFALPFGTPDSFDEDTLAIIDRHYDGIYLTAYGGINSAGRSPAIRKNILRNPVSDGKPPLHRLLWTNHLKARILDTM